jgi:uncharacterized Fe-S cluster-containing radical SAM superfamily protein
MESLKDKYVKLLAGRITVSVDDLTDNEFKLINESFELFSEKLDDIRILNDELKRVNIELINLKAMRDDSENDYD